MREGGFELTSRREHAGASGDRIVLWRNSTEGFAITIRTYRNIQIRRRQYHAEYHKNARTDCTITNPRRESAGSNPLNSYYRADITPTGRLEATVMRGRDPAECIKIV